MDHDRAPPFKLLRDDAAKELAMLATRFNAFDTTAIALRGFIIAIVGGAATIGLRTNEIPPFLAGMVLLVPLIFTELRLRKYFIAASGRFKYLANVFYDAGYDAKSIVGVHAGKSMRWHRAHEKIRWRDIFHREIMIYYGSAYFVLVSAMIYVGRHEKGPEGPFPLVNSSWKTPLIIE